MYRPHISSLTSLLQHQALPSIPQYIIPNHHVSIHPHHAHQRSSESSSLLSHAKTPDLVLPPEESPTKHRSTGCKKCHLHACRDARDLSEIRTIRLEHCNASQLEARSCFRSISVAAFSRRTSLRLCPSMARRNIGVGHDLRL
jgi:hypothetical protein